LTPSLGIWAFIFLSFLFIMVANGLVVSAVIADRRLHQPMYLLFCNLAINDIVANTNILPRVLLDMLRPPSERVVTYPECVYQAFTAHLLATGVRAILMVMAFDRYVAICHPLRYSQIMTHRTLARLIVSAWTVTLVLVSVLLGLTIRLSRCRLLVVGLYCSNAALFGLSCESVVVNNIYGLTFTVVLYVSSVGSMVLTYGSITIVCLRSHTLNRKALQTCISHLLVYLLSLFSGLVTIISTRFPQARQERHLASLMYFIIPASLNPLIYGLPSKEIRNFVFSVFSRALPTQTCNMKVNFFTTNKL
uniref:Odorant receptor, family F, subfamily 115, member 15 n=1 Tax=Neogobius melanostomus TaxID=47308 RepID=A0A8C6UPF3_9GOBI